ncbi:UDP-glycosyltransferase UGT5-like [Schistocerca cancellata]|uniref:UDP-glycosyltransferase UGT5-like n=1 Tax=Schistocerca cancellata TaxID=274614 RepID=UPI00211861F6|nr:UDP-glycosyltransferase UGT5-like [Schistocerca cancellata]
MGASGAQLLLAALALVACLAEGARAAHVLVVFPVGSGSHRNLGQAIARGLHARGHRVTVVSPFPRQQPLQNWTDVAIPNTIHFFGQTSGFLELGSSNNFKKFKMMNDYGISSCEVYLQDENVKRLMNSNEKFDVMIIEIFFCECFLTLSHRLKVPIIQFNTFWPGAWTGDIVGSPSPYAYVPDTFLAYTDHMTFFERLHNAVFGLYCKLIREMYLLPKMEDLVRRHVNDPTMPTLSELDRSTSMLLTNSHVSLQYPRPLAPALVEVGGMHVNPPKKLPKDLQEYLDGAKDGAIYFSLGSNLRSADLPNETRSAIVNAFSKLKQRILWKWEAETFPGKPDNLKLGKWLPQSDILAHKNIRLFITHGGFLSTLETVYHGVPVIGIPVFSDQDLNMLQAESKGYGIRLRLNNITSETFYWAITEILNNPRYQTKAKDLSRLYHDRPRTPMEELVYWTEYVARHKGASHMRSAAVDLSWYQLCLLDVVIFILTIVTVVVSLLVIILRVVLRFLFSSTPKNIAENGIKKNLKKQQ